MVWIHGGGYTSGSCQELPSYDGENLARRGDIVLISLNHRLGPLGFMDLSGIGGGAFADSGNLGMLDLVEALRWVRDNAAAFGGDASNVTIFGQSGGGGKVSTLMAMPAAQGLFHRAIVMSGSLLGGSVPEDSQRLAAATFQELGLAPDDIAGLQKVTTSRLIEAGAAAIGKLSGPQRGPPTPPRPRLPRFGWQPVHDERNIPLDAWKASAPEISRHVPLIVGNVREEFINAAFQYDEDELKARLKAAYGDKSPEIYGAFRKAFPQEPPAKLFAMTNAMLWRNRALDQLRMKQALGGAPAFSYWFTWQPPVLEGRAGAFHCIDLAFCFDNTKRCEQGTGDTREAREIAVTMSQAFINFAKSGNPSQPGLRWPTFDPKTLPTMVFDRSTRVLNDPASEARESVT
jgi:para-nitrobenzyl esterase